MRPIDTTTDLTADRLKSLLHYEPETGVFTWLVRRAVNTPAGKQAGGVHTATGYLLIKIENRKYGAHRLAWLYMTGEWPAELVDHADNDKLNNKWANLRAASYSQNVRNQRGCAASGLKGAYLKTDAGRNNPWASAINLGGKIKHLGTFPTPEDANAAYAKAARDAFGEFARS